MTRSLDTTANLFSRAHRVSATTPDLGWIAGALIIAAITFNAALCFINTHVTPIHNFHVVGSEAVIVAIALMACHRTIEVKDVLLIAAVILYTALLAFIRSGIFPEEGLNLKISRDFLIPIIFILLGKAVHDLRVADRIVYVATALILTVAIFEYFDLEAYLQIFAVIKYYVARGTVDASNPSLQWANGLFLNGIRPDALGGRALLPFLLNDHRVSSLFLESISFGNFGSLVAFWSIIRSRMEQRLRFWSIAAGIVLIVLADSRFNASFLVIGVLFLLMSPRVTTPAVIALPFVAILGLCILGASGAPQDVPWLEGSTLHDRLMYSGRILLDFDILNWLGLGSLRASSMDSGYAYVICNIGLIGFTAFWLWFTSLDGRSRYFYAFRNTIAAYFAALFCISASQFTIKTAALLWFLLGVLSVAEYAMPRMDGARHDTRA